jgi:hypothetical protein
MLNNLYKQCPNPGQTISVARAKAYYHSEAMEWLHGLPDGHIERFVEEGLTPFLKKYGYKSCYDRKEQEKACKEWAFGHVRIQQKGPDLYDRFFIKCAHNGGEEEFDWYVHTIPLEEWETLAMKWSASEFLDDSDAGYAQVIDLAQFAWQLIHLDSSPNHIRWKAIFESSDYDDEYIVASHAQPTEDTGAYGGDRRTL